MIRRFRMSTRDLFERRCPQVEALTAVPMGKLQQQRFYSVNNVSDESLGYSTFWQRGGIPTKDWRKKSMDSQESK